MKIIKEKNKIYFNDNNISFANVTIDYKTNIVFLELLKVVPEYRNSNLAKNILTKIIAYIKSIGYKLINLNPLPLDRNGLNLDQLIDFYKKFNFISSSNYDRAYPYMMSRVL